MVLDATVMDNLATAMGSAISTQTMLQNLVTLIPVIGGVLVFAFTYYIVRRIIKKAQKGKAGI